MKTLLTPTQLIAYIVPEDSKDFEQVIMFGLPAVYYKDSMGFGNTFSLGFDNPEIILGTVDKGVIDFDCEPYLEKYFAGWKSFTSEGYFLQKHKAFISLMDKNKLPLDKKYLIIKHF